MNKVNQKRIHNKFGKSPFQFQPASKNFSWKEKKKLSKLGHRGYLFDYPQSIRKPIVWRRARYIDCLFKVIIFVVVFGHMWSCGRVLGRVGETQCQKTINIDFFWKVNSQFFGGDSFCEIRLLLFPFFIYSIIYIAIDVSIFAFWRSVRVLVSDSSSVVQLFQTPVCSNSAHKFHLLEIQLVCDRRTDGRTDQWTNTLLIIVI